MFNRFFIGIELINKDLNNARSRNRNRIRQESIQSLSIQTKLKAVKTILYYLKFYMKEIEKLEKKEKETKKKRKNQGGQNINLSGTYGKI